MYRFPYPTVCLIVCCGLSVSSLLESVCSGSYLNRQEESVDDSVDQRRRTVGEIVAEPMELKMEALPENFDRRVPGGKQTSTRNGMTTTTARDANRDIKIMEDLKSGIVIEVTRNYGPQDFDALKKMHPELVDYVEMFPDRVDNHEIELNLAIKTVYRSRTLAELKKRHPEAFNIYRRYHAIAEEPIQ